MSDAVTTSTEDEFPEPAELLRVARRMANKIGAGQYAEDAASVAVEKVRKKRPMPWKSYLYRAVVSQVAQQWSEHPKDMRLPSSSLGSLTSSDPGGGGGLPPQMWRLGASLPVVNQDLVARMLKVLTPPQRAVIVLRFWEDLPSTKIAERLGYASAATVDQVLYRAMERLRQAGIDDELALDNRRHYA